ncbi:hypothetical protein GS534_02960 [Rhodococcus hoagii]|nr:hypothetical protein [Prescottella equi]
MALASACGSGSAEAPPASSWPKESFADRIAKEDRTEFLLHLLDVGFEPASMTMLDAINDPAMVCEILHREIEDSRSYENRADAVAFVKGLLGETTSWDPALFVDASKRYLCP